MHPRALAACSVALAAAGLTAQNVWSPPVLETALNSTAADTGPHLSFDGLTLHFASFRSSNWELYVATRPFAGGPWSAPTPVVELNDTAVDDQPFLAVGDLEIFFTSLRAGGAGSSDILRSTRLAPTLPWDPPTFVTELNSPGADAGFSMTADGLEAFFLSTGWGVTGTANQIVRATRTSTALPFNPPAIVTELANPNTHRDCEVSPDGLTLTYSESTPTGVKIHVATRPDRVTPFSPPVVITDFDVVGVNIFGFTGATAGNEAILAAVFGTALGSQQLMNTRRNVLYGAGCGAPAPLALAAPVPILGASWSLTTTNVDPVSPVAFTFFGQTQTAAPLAFLGAPGCSAYTDAVLGSLTAPASGGSASLTLLLPNDPALGGFPLTAQSACLTLGNAFNVYTSNGLATLLGF
jgi:hypothetical protein